jgi:hypothetical protein
VASRSRCVELPISNRAQRSRAMSLVWPGGRLPAHNAVDDTAPAPQSPAIHARRFGRDRAPIFGIWSSSERHMGRSPWQSSLPPRSASVARQVRSIGTSQPDSGGLLTATLRPTSGSAVALNAEGLPELLSHVDTATHLGRKPIQGLGCPRPGTSAMLGAPRPRLPAGRCGTFGGPTRCDRLSTLNCPAGAL